MFVQRGFGSLRILPWAWNFPTFSPYWERLFRRCVMCSSIAGASVMVIVGQGTSLLKGWKVQRSLIGKFDPFLGTRMIQFRFHLKLNLLNKASDFHVLEEEGNEYLGLISKNGVRLTKQLTSITS